MTPAEREALIAIYEGGYAAVRAVLDESTGGSIDSRATPDAWTAREIVHHLADSEMTSAIRLRRLLAEDAPVIYGYDEAAFARVLHYDRPIESSLAAFKAARGSCAELLHLLKDEDWARTGWHSESGVYTVENWLEIYAAHGHDHAEQIRSALAVS